VRVATAFLAIVPVVALKVAEVAAAATMTDAGTVRADLLLVTVTVAPPVGAGAERVTVQVLDELGPRLVGLHASDDTPPEAIRLTPVVAELLL
jgi:hypothetical protein